MYGFIDDNCFEPFNSHLTLKIRKSDPLIDLKKKILGPNERQVVIEQVPDVEAVVIPVGGGGLIAGCAVALKTMNPNIQIIVRIINQKIKINNHPH